MVRKSLDQREGEEQCAELEWKVDFLEMENTLTLNMNLRISVQTKSHFNEDILEKSILKPYTLPIQEYNTTEYKFYYTVLVQSLMMSYKLFYDVDVE